MNKKQNSKQKIQKLAENDARPERAIQPTELLTTRCAASSAASLPTPPRSRSIARCASASASC